MSGMNSGINVNDPTVVAAFKAALLHQGIIALLIFALLGFIWITVRAWLPAAQAARGAAMARPPPRERAFLAAAAADRVWPAVDLRRDLAGPAEDGDRPSLAGHPAHGGEFPALGAAGGELGRDELVVSPDAGRGVGGLDPGRDRDLAARRPPRPAVPPRRPGQRGLGLRGVGLRRIVRRDLRPGADLAVRRPGRGAHLHGGGRADRAARTCLAQPPARPRDARRPGAVPGRHGRAAGLARAGVLAGNLAPASPPPWPA